MKLTEENLPPNHSPESILNSNLEFWDHLNDVQIGKINFDAISKINTWLIMKNGKWLIQANRAGYYGVKNSEDGLDTLPENNLSEAFIKMKHGKIPQNILDQVLLFFREIMKKHNGGEAFCQIYWDLQDEKYIIHVPKQVVSGAAVNYDKEKDLDKTNHERYVFTYECHSHNNMGAFWSGTDNRDENDLRLFGVFGKLGQENYECKHRVFVGDHEIALDVKNIFDQEISRYEVTFPETVESGCSIASEIVARDKILQDETPRFVVQLENGSEISVTKSCITKIERPTVGIPQVWFSSVNTKEAREVVNKHRNYEYRSYGDIKGTGKTFQQFEQQGQNILDKQQNMFNTFKENDEHNDWNGFDWQEVQEATDSILIATTNFEDVAASQCFFEILSKEECLYPLLRLLESYSGEIPMQPDETSFACDNGGYNERF